MNKFYLIVPICLLLTSCVEYNPGKKLGDALKGAQTELTSTQQVLPESQDASIVLTELNKPEPIETKKYLKIENSNVVLYSGTGKIDTLTTKGVAYGLKGIEDLCNRNYRNIVIAYEILKSDGKYGLVEKISAMCGSDSSSTYYIYDFHRGEVLISVEDKIKKYFGIMNEQDNNYYVTAGLRLQSGSINEVNSMLSIAFPDTEPCMDGCWAYAYISDKLLQSKGLIRDGEFVHLPIEDLLK